MYYKQLFVAGYVCIVKFIHENIVKGTEYDIELAITHGHFDIFKYLCNVVKINNKNNLIYYANKCKRMEFIEYLNSL